ncbi:unnamed protein product [Prunus armeniaca]|nr:unnamed protein product [Prunus armeniaca]
MVEEKLNESTNFQEFRDTLKILMRTKITWLEQTNFQEFRHKLEPFLLKMLDSRKGKPYGDSPSELLRFLRNTYVHYRQYSEKMEDIQKVDAIFRTHWALFGAWEMRLGDEKSIVFPCFISPGMGNHSLAHGKVGGKCSHPPNLGFIFPPHGCKLNLTMTEAGGPSAFTDVELDWTSEEEEQTRSESDEDLDEDPDFVDITYAQSEEDGYVDHDANDRDPNAGEEDDESNNNPASPSMCTPEHSSLEYEVVIGNCLKKRKLPNFKDFIPSIDMKNPQFELSLRFYSLEIFRVVVRRHSVLIGRELKFKVNMSTRFELDRASHNGNAFVVDPPLQLQFNC